jgi:hypothetical protein
MSATGAGVARITFRIFEDHGPTWRPDGAKLAFSGHNTANRSSAEIYVADPVSDPIAARLTNDSLIDEYPDWQPLNKNYVRPRGATPMRVPLVPAYKKCAAPQTAHRGAISAASCYSPTLESSYLTVGSPETNGVGANSIGTVLFTAQAAPTSDGLIGVNLTDVRCQGTTGGCSNGALSDYSGNLLFHTNFRITDKNNGPTGVGLSANGTVTDVPLYFSVPCTTTPSTTVGATCSITTSIDSVMGGASAVSDGKRAIWELIGFADGRVMRISDGGPDGIATTDDNTLFAAGGLFFP